MHQEQQFYQQKSKGFTQCYRDQVKPSVETCREFILLRIKNSIALTLLLLELLRPMKFNRAIQEINQIIREICSFPPIINHCKLLLCIQPLLLNHENRLLLVHFYRLDIQL